MSYSSDKLGNLLKINQDFYLDMDCLLGEGQYGSVFKGYQVSKNRTIAIKVVESCEDYAREVEVLKILSLLIHPNIMGFYGFEKQEDKVYLFM